MAEDSAQASEGVRIDRRAGIAGALGAAFGDTDDSPEADNLIFLDEEIADAEQRVKDAQAHLDALKKAKKERS